MLTFKRFIILSGQVRYKAILIEEDSHFLDVCRYVVLNPVRAGITMRPDEWYWSSYKATGT